MEEQMDNYDSGLKDANVKNLKKNNWQCHKVNKSSFEAYKMQPMWICILTGRQFEETFENTQWRKSKKKCSQRDYASSSEDVLRIHLKTHSGEKAKQMQPM